MPGAPKKASSGIILPEMPLKSRTTIVIVHLNT
jgi:hypothetical protein